MTLEPGQVYRIGTGDEVKVLRVGTRAELGLPTEGAWGRIFPDDLVEVINVTPEESYTVAQCMADGWELVS